MGMGKGGGRATEKESKRKKDRQTEFKHPQTRVHTLPL